MTRPPARRARRAHLGQTLVIFALAQLVLLSALGLALDGGFLYLKRRQVQNAADAAALAGAQALSQNATDTVVTQTVLDAAARNGVTDATQVTCRFFTNSYPSGTTQACSSTGTAMSALATAFTGVEVRVAERHQTFVLRAVGTPDAGTAATAAAQVQVATNIKVGPFVVCAINTAVYSAPAGYNGGGIFETSGTFADSGPPKYLRVDGYDNCNGYTCGRAANTAAGGPVINDDAYGYLDASKTIYKGRESAVRFLIHDPSGITDCNDNSSSFKGINTNTLVVTPPSALGSWKEYSGNETLTTQVFAPVITTGNVTSVQSTVEGVNGCVAGAKMDNCIMILPIVDNSGPGGTGSSAAMAWRMLGAFYIQELKNGSHTGALVKNYTIAGDSSANWAPGSSATTVIRLIK